MKKHLFLVPAVLLLAAGCGSSSPSTNNPAPPPTASASLKFSDQPYYGNAYLISGSSLSGDAQKALTGFSMSKQTNTDGSVTITLKALESGYHDQQYTLQAGQQLYFIEKFLGDDAQTENQDHNLADDTGVVVDSQGNIVSVPTGWTQQ